MVAAAANHFFSVGDGPDKTRIKLSKTTRSSFTRTDHRLSRPKVDRVNPPPVIGAPVTLEQALNSTTGDFVYVRVAEARPEVTFS